MVCRYARTRHNGHFIYRLLQRLKKPTKKMAISVIRVPLFYHPQLPVARNVSGGLRKVNYRSNRFTLLAQYSQTHDLFSSPLQILIIFPNCWRILSSALRLAQGIQAFVGVGGERLADVSKSTSSSSTRLPTQLELGLLSPLYLRRLFERMGATYIIRPSKNIFLLQSAPTLFAQEYVLEFQNCFDRAPAVPFEEIETILHEDLGKTIESVYEYVDPTPLVSASIAQVHGARLRGSQEDVVIKVLKPRIEDVLVADLNFVYVVARILEFLNPELSRTSLRTATNATAVSANVVDERQMNALFLDVMQVNESYGLRFPREFALLMKQLLYFDRYTRLLAPQDEHAKGPEDFHRLKSKKQL
ncbi:hypothetical protein Ddye_020451 [Dipteronia dyeriana]|uniref:ABC1 atypical kinase-like domain-containing protein n=1 Tax=Dipteronia dyeriana TaxID=168575 RepID=A0AAD9WW03_9ROSI|nr:hypothetical protein Ddye_020451 [Dipteronia dyeriana]